VYDVIVVGARCAGSPTAMLLARKGYRVLLIDKAAFPSDIVNGYYVQHLSGLRCQEGRRMHRTEAGWPSATETVKPQGQASAADLISVAGHSL
jgi:glycine/D-amino acid oxidase-like deaminating enzyme